MVVRLLGLLLLAPLCGVAVFGLYVPMTAHGDHAAPCPFSLGTAALCVPTTHIAHWQTALLAVLAEVVVLVCFFTPLFFAQYRPPDPDVGRYAAFRARRRIPQKPTLLQELFSDGILNRKESYSWS